ncbi:CRISPR-associated endonuclease Cas3'' [Streptomyces exfoliatus]|uniref:CRISPR-associated endonuclease Cas3'' n=1 Tax=Streptomyces exfoliatus TaxID=1905 RepID=UPI0037BD58AE
MSVFDDGRLCGIDQAPWAKFDARTGVVYPLLFHQIDTGAAAEVLWDRFLSPSQRALIAGGVGVDESRARQAVAFLAALHDVGKLIPCFQCDVAAGKRRLGEGLLADMGRVVQVPHARASMHAGLGLLEEWGFAREGNDSPAVRGAQVLGGHHGRFLQLDVDQGASPARVEAALGGPLWRDLRRRYTRLMWHIFDVREAPKEFSAEAAVLVTGLVMMADRLASRRRFWIPLADTPSFGAFEHATRVRELAQEAVEQAGLDQVTLPRAAFTTVHEGVAGPNALQASVLEQLPGWVRQRGSGIAVVTDATGSGKSVNGLEMARIFNAACGTNGVLWLLPTTATADAAFERLDRYVRAHGPERAPTAVVHSGQWLSAAYPDPVLADEGGSVIDSPEGPGGPEDPHTPESSPAGQADRDPTAGGGLQSGPVPDSWQRGWDRALLAQYTVATVDQAQMAVLPVRYNALRMLGICGKTVVVDEAHALQSFSQLQLRRLLNWLGAFGCPVVLLSATLPASTSSDLIRAYLTGAGHPPRTLQGRSFAPKYPGWVFVDADSATAHHMDDDARDAHTAAQRRRVRITTVPVTHRRVGWPGRPIEAGERLAAVEAALAPILRSGAGCATVACATVADAQDTYTFLRHHWQGPAEDLVLLHARREDHQREHTLRTLRRRLGKHGPRPRRLVVVTTSLLDMSLDIDVDLMVSDLASIGRLVQRAGRLGRFTHLWAGQEGWRPPWWNAAEGPTLTVLHPVGSRGATALPPGWGSVEPAATQHATAHLLTTGALTTLTLPDDVQNLVEQVHGHESAFATETDTLQRLMAGQHARTDRQLHTGAVHLIPPPARVASLADLHRQHLTTAQAATRLGTMRRRLIPCYRTPTGTWTLDPDGQRPLPDKPRLTPGDVRSILAHSLLVPAAWVTRPHPRNQPPAGWQRHALLAGTILLPTDPDHPNELHRFGHYELRMDPDLGLVHRRDQH